MKSLQRKIQGATIKEPIRGELEIFEEYFRSAMSTRISLLTKILRFVLKRKGKQLRPVLVLLAAKAVSGEVVPKTYRGAALIELLHTATLIHDDVVDESYKRRGFFSLNALWKNKIAVLVGDFLLSRGLLMAIEYKDYDLLEITSKAVKVMSEGELLQMEKARTYNLDEALYFDIIRQKTASLLGACLETGTASVSENKELQEQMYKIGETLGIAFQIKDDLLDYGVSAKNIGKPKGIDIKEGKITLPLIHALNRSTKKERRRMLRLIKKQKRTGNDLQEIIDWVYKYQGIDYAVQQMKNFAEKSVLMIEQTLPPSPARQALKDVAEYVVNREK